MAKKAYIGVANFEKRNLPNGYTQLSHIESTGVQYFDTGVKPSVGTRAVVGFQATSTPTGNWWILSAVTSGTVLWRAGVNASAFRTDGGFSYSQTSSLTDYTVATGTCTSNMSIPLYLFAQNEGGAVEFGKFKLYSCQMYNGDVLIRDYVPCKNPSGVVGLYDMGNGTFGGSGSTTAFVSGSSAPSVARKIKKGYIGVDGKARKIKKAYIGIGGVARPCWSGGELAYYGSITALSVARSELAATTIGNYALFGGGQNYGSYYSTVDAYNASLVRSTPTALSVAKYTLGATSVGNYALFAGGQTKSSSISATVDTYNKSLTKSTATDLRIGRNNISATTIGNYALFAGGSSTGGYAYVDAYDGSLTKTSPTNLSESKTQLAATTIGDYALFAGGTTEPDAGYAKNSVDTYNKSLTKGTATKMQESKYLLAATTVGGYAIFFGGTTGYTYSGTTVDAYNASLTRTAAPTARKYNRKSLSATTVEGFAIFAGGLDQDEVMNVVEVYDGSLTKTMTTTLSAGRFRLSATTIGNYALFGGGKPSRKSANSDVEAFTVA